MKPDYSKAKIELVQKTLKELRVELGREPIAEEIAVVADIKADEVRELLNYRLEKPEAQNEFYLKFKLTIKNNELERIRRAKNLKQADIAAKLGVSGATYGQIECCRAYPSLERQEKIADILGVSVADIFPEWLKIFTNKWKRAEKSQIVPVNQISLSNPVVLSLHSPVNMEESVDRIILKEYVKDILPILTDRERGIIEMRFGIGDGITHTLEETGREFGVSRERIRSIEAKALSKMRCSTRSEIMESFQKI